MVNASDMRQKDNLRWVILALTYNVAVLHGALKDHFSYLEEKFEFYFNLLCVVYQMPNILLPFIGGIMITRLGTRFMFIFFSFFVSLGVLIYALGCASQSMATMLMGRIVMGLGGECFGICQTALIIKWFSKDKIALPLGLIISLGRIGTVLNAILTPKFTSSRGITFSLWVGFGISLASFFLTLLVCSIDKRSDVKMKISYHVEYQQKEEEMIAKNSRNEFSTMFWLIAFLSICLYGSVFPFNYISYGFITETWLHSMPKNKATELAGLYISLPNLMSSFLIPAFGCLVDSYGKRSYLLILSCGLGLVSFILFQYMYPIIPLIFLGLTYSLFAAVIWPCFSIVVKPEIAGYAIGMVSSMINLSLVINPLMFSFIFSYSQSYFVSILFFIFLMCIAFITSLLIAIEDQKNNNIINKANFSENCYETKGIKMVENEQLNKESVITNSYKSLITSRPNYKELILSEDIF